MEGVMKQPSGSAADEHKPEPGPKRPAPGELELVRAFLNTIDIETGEEKLSDPAALRVWLAERDLLGSNERAAPGDLRKAIELREALRAMVGHNNGDPLDAGATGVLDGAAARAKLGPRFAADGPPSVEPQASGVDGALGRVLAIVFASMAEGSWERLKICRADTCRWAFYDWTKNHSGSWCTMKICGNREKVRSYRSRARSEARSSR